MEYAWNNNQILMEYGGEYWWNKIVWMDTIKEGRYGDTNKLFEAPLKNHNLRVTKWIDENQLFKCLEDFNLGTMDTESFSNGLMERLAKLL